MLPEHEEIVEIGVITVVVEAANGGVEIPKQHPPPTPPTTPMPTLATSGTLQPGMLTNPHLQFAQSTGVQDHKRNGVTHLWTVLGSTELCLDKIRIKTNERTTSLT